ncbi:MAG: type VI secretion system ATPase TssH, partial [Mailhella sp.]|nr:type VI secretion system ATPase TssH [Mailhella sp.]
WALLLSFLLSGCAARQESRTVFCMDTVMTLRVSGPVAAQALERVEAELKRFFRPEFLNRVDETVMFHPLRMSQVGAIIDLQIRSLRRRLEERKISLELDPAARSWIASVAYDPAYGARPLKRWLQHGLETKLAREVIAGRIRDGQSVRVVTAGEGDDTRLEFVTA